MLRLNIMAMRKDSALELRTMIREYQRNHHQRRQQRQSNSAEDIHSEQQSPIRSLSTTRELEAKLKEARTQERALEALTQVHCAESLTCLLELFRWEDETDECKKKALEIKIIGEFMTNGVPNEIFLPETVLQDIKTGKSNLSEAKKHILRDLRFNSALLNVINGAA